MSYNTTLLIQCEDLQGRMNEVWDANITYPNDPIPFLEYLMSPENRNGINQIVNPGNGKSRNINLVWAHRISEDDVVTATERGCETTNKYGEHVEQYSIDTTDLVVASEEIKIVDLTRVCQNNPNYIASRMVALFDAIDRKVSTKIATQYTAIEGDYSADAIDHYGVDADGDLVVQTLDSSGNVRPTAFQEIQSAAMMSGFNGIVGFGGALLNDYIKLSRAGCCTNFGLDIGELYNLYGYAFAYDRRLATALGGQTENMIMQPQALQVLTYTETPAFDGLNFNSGYEAFSAVTNAGVPVDVYIANNCPGVIKINVFANVKLVGLPSDLFLAGDNFSGVNYTAGVTVTNPALT